MPRPPGGKDLLRRAKAYEMYAAGLKKADIAREIGVTRPAVSAWARQDRWDERLAALVNRASDAAEWSTENALAKAMASLRLRLARRIEELEGLCGPGNHPSTRLNAIKLWLQMAGADKGTLVEPAKHDPGISLIDDLAKPEEKL